MDTQLQIEVLKLQLKKKYQEAADLLRQAPLSGDATAKVMLALIGEKVGITRSVCDNLIADVERSGPHIDFDTNFQLFKAYDAYMGVGEPDEMPKKALKYHQQAALAENAPIQVVEAVAHRFRYGSSGNSIDLSAAIKWYELALSRGSAKASIELAKLADTGS